MRNRAAAGKLNFSHRPEGGPGAQARRIRRGPAEWKPPGVDSSRDEGSNRCAVHPGRTIKEPLLRAIVQDANLSVDEFIELL